MKPPRTAKSFPLTLQTLAAGTRLGRMIKTAHGDPLGFAKTPSRFSDPRKIAEAKRFGVVYFGESLEVCFLEAFLRDKRSGSGAEFPVGLDELQSLSYVEVQTARPLSLVNLKGRNPVVMGVPTDVSGAADQALARQWALFFYKHPVKADGIIYESRLNDETNVAVFDRALSGLNFVRRTDFLKTPGAGNLLTLFRVAIIA